MRVLIIAALAAAGVTAGACNRDEKAAAKTPERSDFAAPAANPGASEPASTPANKAAPAATSDVRTAAVSFREVTIPAGTTLPLVLDTAVGSDTSRLEQPVQAHLGRPIVIHGQTVVADGSRVSGVVTDVKRSGKVKGRAELAVRFDSLAPRGGDERYRIHTSSISRIAPATKKKDAAEIGAPAAGGALIGAIVGGKKGAAIGAAAGGGAGTAVVLTTRGKEVHLPRGSALSVRLTEPVTVKVKG